MVEAKFEDQDDLFDDSPSDNDFLRRNNERPMQTLGQLTSYATAHLAAQFRTPVFPVLLFRESTRLMRWDRAGLIVSERIPLGSSYLADFFWRFSKASPQRRCHDTTVTPFRFENDLTKESLFSKLQFSADPGNVKIEDVSFFEMLLPLQNRRYVIGKATYLGVASLASRATRSFKGWCLTTNRPVVLKDTWRIVSDAQRPEHYIYEKLADAKVQHVATVHDYSDIPNHRTVTGDLVREPWVCRTDLKSFRTLQHYRLVLKEIGRSLTSFDNFREVLVMLFKPIERLTTSGMSFTVT